MKLARRPDSFGLREDMYEQAGAAAPSWSARNCRPKLSNSSLLISNTRLGKSRRGAARLAAEEIEVGCRAAGEGRRASRPSSGFSGHVRDFLPHCGSAAHQRQLGDLMTEGGHRRVVARNNVSA